MKVAADARVRKELEKTLLSGRGLDGRACVVWMMRTMKNGGRTVRA